MTRSTWLVAAALGGAWLPACRTEQTIVEPDPHLERMLVQPKRLAYDEDPLLSHGMAMQSPPDGTRPIDAISGAPEMTRGEVGGRWVERIPVPIDRTAIEAGRANFEIFCAACHGVLGDGVSVVAAKMALRKPPSLLESRVRAYPVGRVFHALRAGYGLMPSYAAQLSVVDAWTVVAYVRALQLAREADVATLPPEDRAELEKEAM
jgi:mono/diheme cytochrome c family protein